MAVLRLSALCTVLAGAAPPRADALDPSRAVSQYSVRTWRGSADFPQDATIQAITQTDDGYLWLGTMEGLLRFDGVRATSFVGTAHGLPNDNIWALRVDGTGRIWAGTDGGGVFIWKNGPVETLSKDSGVKTDAIRPILRTRDGAMWVGTARAGISRYKDGQWTYLTTRQGLGSDSVWSLAEAPDGSVWAGAGGLSRCREDVCSVVRTHKDGLPGNGVTALAVARNGDLWVGMWAGLSRLHDGVWTDWTVANGLPGGIVRAIHEDRDGNIWIGTNEGLARVRDGRFETMTKDHGGAGGYVRAIFEDKEGTLWVGAANLGLTALSDGQFLNIGDTEGLPHHNVRAVLAAPDGTLWAAAGTTKGLTRWKDGRVDAVRGLPSDAVRSLALDPDNGGLWIGLQDGLVHWRENGGVVRHFTFDDGIPPNAPASLHVDSAGTLWVGTLDGLGEYRQGRWRVHTPRDGLPGTNVFSLAGGRDDVLWVGTQQGVARWKDGSWSTPGGPDNSIYAVYEDRNGILWVGTNGGFWRLENGRWTSFRLADGFCADAISYILEDDLEHLWLTSPKGLCRVSRAALNAFAAKQTQSLPWRIYDRSDGIRDTGFALGTWPRGGKLSDGRLVFATSGGIVIAEPRKLRTDSAPPVTVEALTADNVAVPLAPGLAVGPGRPRLEFRFTALTLVAPEKIHFRYRLDGFDAGWIENRMQRTASYTNIPPGRYVFRVGAANSDGVWNDAGTPIEFTVRPHFWETAWFRALCAVMFAAALGLGYSWRVRRIRALNEELERRVREALHQIQTLKGLLPICASCKKIRDDGGYWNQIETYVSNHSGAEFSHSICPDCLAKLYPEYAASTIAAAASDDTSK